MFRYWNSPEAVFQILKKVSAGQPCDITGIRDYAHLDAEGGVQWPWREAEHPTSNVQQPTPRNGIATESPPQERRLFADGKFFTPDGRARILFDPPRPAPERPDAEFPFWLNTGRGSSAQWHTGSRTNKSDVLRALAPPGCYVELNPADAARLGITPNTRVRVASRRASLIATAFITSTVQPGQIFIPMHYAEVNRLTHPSFDAYSRQPNYKYCAARVEAAG